MTSGADFSYIFSGENSAENFSPKNVGKNQNFPRKKFWKIISTANSTEFSAEKKIFEKSAPEFATTAPAL
jgi:hypothetical protein